MRLIYRRSESDAHEGPWMRWRIPPEGAALLPAEGGGIEIRAGRDARAAAHVVPFRDHERESAALVLGAGTDALLVDGGTPLRISVLEERAEIASGGDRVYFTVREPLAVTIHEGDEQGCALCGEPVGGAEVIACTGCGAVTHEGALAGGGERRCFTHHGRCPRCHLTRRDFAWTPPEDGA